jgi:hypothetical protein
MNAPLIWNGRLENVTTDLEGPATESGVDPTRLERDIRRRAPDQQPDAAPDRQLEAKPPMIIRR